MRATEPIARRGALGAVGLAVAAMIGIVLPVAYGTFGYLERSEVLAFKARLNAAKVAKLIYGREKLWQYRSVRLDEVLEVPSGAVALRQRVLDSSGKLVFDNGRELVRPFCAARYPSSWAPPP